VYCFQISNLQKWQILAEKTHLRLKKHVFPNVFSRKHFTLNRNNLPQNSNYCIDYSPSRSTFLLMPKIGSLPYRIMTNAMMANAKIPPIIAPTMIPIFACGTGCGREAGPACWIKRPGLPAKSTHPHIHTQFL
jgi:hypothetical protein